MTDVLTADDPLYEELYDVRREAEAVGNFIDVDVMPRLHALRAQAPVHKGRVRDLLGLPGHDRHARAVGRQHYTALTYEACEAGFRDPETFSNRVQGHDNPAGEITMGILEMDPPMHRAYRRTIQPKFLMPEALDWWRRRTIDGIIERLIERMARGDRADLNLDFCARIPVYTITTAIGLDGDDALRFRHAYLNSTSSSRNVTMADRIANGRIVEDLLLGLIAARRAEPQDDLISFLLQSRLMVPGQEPRPLTDREIMTHAKLVMVAGGGTSWRQMGITLFALLTHRDQFAAVKADRALLDDAIEEGLRWNPTAPYFYRMVMRDVEFHGHHIPEGSVLELCLGPANRDPARWDHPDAFDIHRPRLTNMAFGLGTHRCLGMNVARVEIARGITALMDNFPDLRLDPDAPAPFMTGGLEQQGVSGLPVLLR
ncbi:cytochrome P450 [Novosphingobium album (ex Liu et al. 2023)]|uniref:Cytochrome P450 n=1 Tax=Novosphingobium album (ex Liu et al. 2023) TaxID=3031130 RepID=A0ABT5WRP8_9SPHN|nr:cytochrome P450 [Novosphingobium album (ex Liu et al. 2023)]MDE8652718.1 cytochrome P450 [Novosphingobium album (ex Liu et al. 2023)]